MRENRVHHLDAAIGLNHDRIFVQAECIRLAVLSWSGLCVRG